MMRQEQGCLTLRSDGPGLRELTGRIAQWLHSRTIRTGLLTLFIRHTSASLLIQENADPDVLRDLEEFFLRLVPEDQGRYRHRAEGPDDMPAHIRSALTQSQLTIPISEGVMSLGTWQGVFLFEHRRAPQRRDILLHLIGE